MSATLWNLQHQENCHLCRLEQILLLSSLSNMRLVFQAKIFSAPFTFERSYLTEMMNLEQRAIFLTNRRKNVIFFIHGRWWNDFWISRDVGFGFRRGVVQIGPALPQTVDGHDVALNRRQSRSSYQLLTVMKQPQTVDGQDLATNWWQSWSSRSRKPLTVSMYRIPTTVMSQQQQLLAGNFWPASYDGPSVSPAGKDYKN